MISFISIGIGPVYHNEKAVATISKNLLFGLLILCFNSIKTRTNWRKERGSGLKCMLFLTGKSLKHAKDEWHCGDNPVDHTRNCEMKRKEDGSP